MDSVLFSTPANPVPEDHKSGFFEGFDKAQIRYAVFRSTGQNAKGTIILVHGRNECIEKYYETINHFTKAGFWVATFDWRGQGGSERLVSGSPAGFVKNFDDYEADLQIFIEQIVLPDTRMPFYAFGHSMGGLVLLSSAPRISNRVERMVVAAPFLGLPMGKLKLSLLEKGLKFLNFFGYGQMLLRRDSAMDHKQQMMRVTSDPDRYARNSRIFVDFPEFRAGPPTVRWLSVMLSAVKHVDQQSYLERIRVPTIIFGGTDDGVVPFEKFEAISTKFRAGRLIAFSGARHEIVQEVDIYREPALDATIAFFISDDDELLY